MRKNLLFLFALLPLFWGCQSFHRPVEEFCCLSSITIVDQNGFSETISSPERLKRYEQVDFLTPMPFQKVIRVRRRDGRGDIRTFLTAYHSNGQPMQYLEILNGRACGAYKEFYPNGMLRMEGSLVGGEPDVFPGAEKSWIFEGLARSWHEGGSLQAEIPYSNGLIHGLARYFHPNGQIWKEIFYQKGRIEGCASLYLDSGELLQTAHYREGVREGKTIRFWCGGKRAAEEVWSEGLLKSGCYFSLEGDLFCSVSNGSGFRAFFAKDYIQEIHEFREGREEGAVKVFNRDGEPLRIYQLKGGLKEGEDVLFYSENPGRAPKVSAFWVEGVLQGTVKTWYPNGVQESQRQMSDHQKQGLFSAWYQDGSLMLIEEYENNLVIKGKYFKKGSKDPVSEIRQGEGTATFFDKEGRLLEKVEYKKGKPRL